MHEKQIRKEYKKFFEYFKINETTGIFKHDQKSLRFATYPYIGSKYFYAKEKILFVGMDIGSDERLVRYNEDRYQSFEERNKAIEQSTINYNPHIAGTYCSALYLLKDNYNWAITAWDKLPVSQTYTQVTKKEKRQNYGENPLAFVSLTNLWKFVTVGRTNKTGGTDREFIKQEVEESWLLKDIELLRPDIVFIQGKHAQRKISPATIKKIKERGISKLLYAPHPSYREKGGRIPHNYVDKFKPI